MRMSCWPILKNCPKELHVPRLTPKNALALAVAASAAALALALVPYGGPPDELQGLFHGGAFLVISFFFAISLPRKPWGGITVAFLLGLLIEGAQYFVPGRSASVEDIIANCAGIVAGGLLYAVLRFAGSRKSSTPV